jgi:glycosyltransferase involved in cell wall biosynthesis
VTISAPIPAFNEEERIAAVVSGVRPHVPDVVVVDGGSADRTAERAAAAGAMGQRGAHRPVAADYHGPRSRRAPP